MKLTIIKCYVILTVEIKVLLKMKVNKVLKLRMERSLCNGCYSKDENGKKMLNIEINK